LETGVHQGVGEAIALEIQLSVGPAPSVGGGDHRRAVSVPAHIAHKTLDPGVAGFEYLSEIFHFSVFWLQNKIKKWVDFGQISAENGFFLWDIWK
jgi:hypothetical protein